MRILLVNPPIPKTYYNSEFCLPLSLLYLAAALRDNGDDPRILDLKIYSNQNVSDFEAFYSQKLMESVSSINPDMIGFGCLYSGQFHDIVNYSKLITTKYPDIPIILGGIHPTIYPKEILANCPSIDWIVIAEGEETLVKFVNKYKNKDFNFDDIDGFAYRKEADIIVNPKTYYIKDIDKISMPAYDLINLKDYYVDTSGWFNPKNLSINTSIPIITSRSCPNRCNFCCMYHVMGPAWRARSPENVVNEIEFLYDKYDHRHYSFMDDNITLDKKRAIKICDLILKRNLDIQFETPNGLSINTLSAEVLDALVSAGMVRTNLAIESGCDFIRNKIMRKNLPREKILEVAKLIKRYKNLKVSAFFIMGMPEDTEDTLRETYDLIQQLNFDRVYLMNIVPFPGTEVFEQAKKDNLLIDSCPEKSYLSDDMYLTNYNKLFLKPYKLQLQDLRNFRSLCEKLPCVKKMPSKQAA